VEDKLQRANDREYFRHGRFFERQGYQGFGSAIRRE
jgi:hypothetical protein